MKKNIRTLCILLLLMLTVTLGSCVTYIPREEDTTPEQTTEETTANAPETESEPFPESNDESGTAEPESSTANGSEDDTAYPNETEDGYSKRY